MWLSPINQTSLDVRLIRCSTIIWNVVTFIRDFAGIGIFEWKKEYFFLEKWWMRFIDFFFVHLLSHHHHHQFECFGRHLMLGFKTILYTLLFNSLRFFSTHLYISVWAPSTFLLLLSFHFMRNSLSSIVNLIMKKKSERIRSSLSGCWVCC